MFRILLFLTCLCLSAQVQSDEWISSIDLKYKVSNPELFNKVSELKTLIDSWNNESDTVMKSQLILNEIFTKDDKFVPVYRQYARFLLKAGIRPTTSKDGMIIDRVEKMLKQAIEFEPDDADSYVLLGHHYTREKRYLDAENALNIAENLGTKNVWIDLNWAELLMKQNNYDAALDRYLIIENSKITNRKVFKLALSGLIKYYKKIKNLEYQEQYHQKLIRFEPEEPFWWGNYAILLLCEKGDAEGAIEHAKTALSLMNYGNARRTLGAALYHKWSMAIDEGASVEEAQALFDEAYAYYSDLSEVFDLIYTYKAMSSTSKKVIDIVHAKRNAQQSRYLSKVIS